MGLICYVCCRTPRDGVQLYAVGHYQGRMMYRCQAHANDTTTPPPIDVEVTVVEDKPEKAKADAKEEVAVVPSP